MNSPANNQIIQRKAFVVLLIGLLLLSLYVVFPFLYTILMSGVLAVLFYPLHRKYLRFVKDRKSLAASMSVISVMVLFLLPIFVLITILTGQIAGLVQKFPESFSNHEVTGILAHWQFYITPWIEKIEQIIGLQVDLIGMVQQSMQWLGQAIAQYSPAVVAKTAGFFLNLIIMLILLFYLFRDGSLLVEKIILLSPIKDKYERKLAGEIEGTIYGIFYGSFLTGAIQAFLATVGFYIAQIPGALVWGVVTFFVSFIPLVGTGAVIIPLIIYLLVQGSYSYAIFLTIYGVVVIGGSDNFLRPLLIRTNVHQALIFLSLFGGLAVFGPMGILLGPIVMALLSGTIKIYEDNYL